MQIVQKNHYLRKYLSRRSTLGRYIDSKYRIEPNLHISPSVNFANFEGNTTIFFFIFFLIAALIIR